MTRNTNTELYWECLDMCNAESYYRNSRRHLSVTGLFVRSHLELEYMKVSALGNLWCFSCDWGGDVWQGNVRVNVILPLVLYTAENLTVR